MQKSKISSRPSLGLFQKAFQHGDRPYRYLLVLAVLITVALVLGIGYELWQNSTLSRHAFGWKFLITTTWDPALTNTFGGLAVHSWVLLLRL